MNAYSIMHSSMLTEANLALTLEAVDRTFILSKAANLDNDLYIDPISEQVTFEGITDDEEDEDESEEGKEDC